MMKMFELFRAALTAQTAAAEETAKMFFEPGRFLEMLRYMGVGMLIIFVLIGIIILATLAINKVFSKSK
ncbi:MAG: hypothetical protein IJ404_02665 [Clostridia bacterium]|nr:hypothetical protein [Clostridia bacterium]MBQ8893184.1 hypothetical protein [Clostridia bacterium]